MAAVVSRIEPALGTSSSSGGGIAMFRSKFRKGDRAINKGGDDRELTSHLSVNQELRDAPAMGNLQGNQSSVTLGGTGQGRKRGFSLRQKMRLGGKSQKAPSVPQLPPALELDFGKQYDGATMPGSQLGERGTFTPAPRAQTKSTSEAALIAAQASASFTQAKREVPKPRQQVKALEAMANARLDVEQARDLVRLGAQQIKQRGVETSGLFRAFRVAQSQKQIDHLVQLFLVHVNPAAYANVFSVLPENALERLSQRPDEAPDKAKVALEELDREIRYASIHDVVAFLKWGLRHTRLRAVDFNSTDAYAWYAAFAEAESAAGYPARAIADLLHPKLPQETAELLSETLEMMATVAAHQHANHMPAAEICSILGFWLFGRIGVAHPPPTYPELQKAWQKATSIAEHLLLAHIRSQAAVTFAMPLRLTELVGDYPVLRADTQKPGFPPAFARRQIHTLKVDLRSENLIVSPSRPRLPSTTLASALDASASETLEGGRGETWAAVIGQLDVSAVEGGKGHELLIPEHGRILQLVDVEMAARDRIREEAESESSAGQLSTLGSSYVSEMGSLSPSSSYGRLSKSYSDLRRHQRLSTLKEDAPPNATDRGRNPRLAPPPAASALTATQLNSGELGSSTDATKVKRLSTEWRSFSEGGFGTNSSVEDLALDHYDLKPVSSHNSQTLPSRRGLARKSSFGGNSLGRRRSTRGGFPDYGDGSSPTAVASPPPPPPTFIATSVSMITMDTSLTTLWQDSLLDNSLCSMLPPLVLVQLNERVAGEADLLSDYARDERPWLLITETVLPPRPPTPPPSNSGKGGRGRNSIFGGNGDDRSLFDSRSIFAPSIRSMKVQLQKRMSVFSPKARATKRSDAVSAKAEAAAADAEAPKTPQMPGGWS